MLISILRFSCRLHLHVLILVSLVLLMISGTSFDSTSKIDDFHSARPSLITWIDTVNVLIMDRSLTAKGTYNSARSLQIIPDSSNGYIKCDWHILSQAKERGWKFGFIGANDVSSVGNIMMSVNFLANTNTDVYEGVTYQTTISGGTAIQKPGVQHRWRVDRSSKKIYYETSIDGSFWTLRATSRRYVSGELRAGFYGNESGKMVINATIQSDLGLK